MKSAKRQHGQTIQFVAIALVGLLGMVGLVIDGGRGYSEKRSIQAAAEAAAHAGAYTLQAAWDGSGFGGLTDADVANAARTYASRNGWNSAQGQFYLSYVHGDMTTQSQTLNSNVRGVLVQLSHPQQPSFTSVVGAGTYDIFGRATAMFGSSMSAPALPLAVNDDAFRGFGTTEGLQPASAGGGYGNFNFASIVPPGCTVGDQVCYTNAMRNGSGQPIQIGVAYPANSFDSAQLSTTSAQALQDRINLRPAETCTSFTIPSPRVVYLPIVNGDVGGTRVTFIRFRAFFIAKVDAPSGFSGCFVRVSSSVGTFDPNAVGTGYGGVTLMKLVPSPGSVTPVSVTVTAISSPNHASGPNCPRVPSECQTATLSITTQPGAFCTVVVSDPQPSRAGGLGAQYADSAGKVSWTWNVDSTAPVGSWPVRIMCSYQAVVGRGSTTLIVT